MAKITLHALLTELRGNFNGIVVRKIRGGYFLTRKAQPQKGRKPTPRQKAFRSRFGLASAYAKQVQRNAEASAYYAPFAKSRDLRIRAVAISDWFHPPVVDEIKLGAYRGRAGDTVTILAHDDFEVVRVKVAIIDAKGNVLESGEAVRQRTAWKYVATRTIPADERVTVCATAYDRPRRTGERSVTWPRDPAKA